MCALRRGGRGGGVEATNTSFPLMCGSERSRSLARFRRVAGERRFSVDAWERKASLAFCLKIHSLPPPSPPKGGGGKKSVRACTYLWQDNSRANYFSDVLLLVYRESFRNWKVGRLVVCAPARFTIDERRIRRN